MAEPTRSCDVCWKRFPKSRLKRWVSRDGGLQPDREQQLPGRGWYSCSPECEEKLPAAARRKQRKQLRT